MSDYLELGPTPFDEQCAQVGEDDYSVRIREETERYIKQLEQRFPNLPDGVRFKTKAFPHDFGTYHEVVVIFNPNDEAQAKAAFHVEWNLPCTWEDNEVFPL
jgi:hypothetical protein